MSYLGSPREGGARRRFVERERERAWRSNSTSSSSSSSSSPRDPIRVLSHAFRCVNRHPNPSSRSSTTYLVASLAGGRAAVLLLLLLLLALLQHRRRRRRVVFHSVREEEEEKARVCVCAGSFFLLLGMGRVERVPRLLESEVGETRARDREGREKGKRVSCVRFSSRQWQLSVDSHCSSFRALQSRRGRRRGRRVDLSLSLLLLKNEAAHAWLLSRAQSGGGGPRERRRRRGGGRRGCGRRERQQRRREQRRERRRRRRRQRRERHRSRTGSTPAGASGGQRATAAHRGQLVYPSPPKVEADRDLEASREEAHDSVLFAKRPLSTPSPVPLGVCLVCPFLLDPGEAPRRDGGRVRAVPAPGQRVPPSCSGEDGGERRGVPGGVCGGGGERS